MYRDREIIGCLRDPFDRLVSIYFFGWWKKVFPNTHPNLHDTYPHFPELTFEQFFETYQSRDNKEQYLFDIPDATEQHYTHGVLTLQFIRFFALDIEKGMRMLVDKGEEATLKELLGVEVKFLYQEEISNQFADYLTTVGVGESELKDIRQTGRVYKTKERADKSWREVIPSNIIQRILYEERVFFKLFPHYKISLGE